MIKVIGKKDCSGCTTTKQLLEDEGIEFEYYYLDQLDNESKREYIKIARNADQAFFPIIFKDGVLVSIKDYQSGVYLEGLKRVKVTKRNGLVIGFNQSKVQQAIIKAMAETDKGVDEELANIISSQIYSKYKTSEKIPNVEDIQDEVEELLALNGRFDTAKRYVLYRSERAKLRGKTIYSKYKYLSDNFLSTYKHKQDPFPTELGKFVYYRTYSRPIPEENRRERWWETVARVVEFSSTLEVNAMKRQGLIVNELVLDKIKSQAKEIYDMMYNLKLFPSGRSLWVGNTKSSYEYPLSNFNCSFLTIDSLKKFSEMFFVLMLGTGVGLSVERKYISKLPKINSDIEIIHKDYTPVPKHSRNEHTELVMKTPSVLEIVIGDSKFGWSRAMELYLEIISNKQYKDIEFILINYDNVRPAGEILRTFGGRASGHTAIKSMFEKIHNIFQAKKEVNKAQWQIIKPIDCLDMATIIAENVISGGVRRSALIVFCDNDETEVLKAKANLYYQDSNGNWNSNDKLLHRMLSNNTVFYYDKPTKEQLHNQFELIKTSGEPSFGNMAEMKRRREDVQGGNPLTV